MAYSVYSPFGGFRFIEIKVLKNQPDNPIQRGVNNYQIGQPGTAEQLIRTSNAQYPQPGVGDQNVAGVIPKHLALGYGSAPHATSLSSE